MTRSGEPSDLGARGIVHAVFENGVFRPRGSVALPERSEVEFEPRLIDREAASWFHRKRIHALLERSIETGEPDMAARHDELLP